MTLTELRETPERFNVSMINSSTSISDGFVITPG
jgi:hypothetical protein